MLQRGFEGVSMGVRRGFEGNQGSFPLCLQSPPPTPPPHHPPFLHSTFLLAPLLWTLPLPKRLHPHPALARIIHASHDSPTGCSRRRPGVLPKRLFSVSKLADGNSRHNRYYKPKRSLGFRPAKAIPRPPHNTPKHTIRPTPLRIRPPSAAPPWATAAGLTGLVT